MFDLNIDAIQKIDERCRIILILKILADKSSAKKPLTQKQIVEELDEYGLKCQTRTVAELITALKGILKNTIVHNTKKMPKGYYMRSHNCFETNELRTLIDSVLFNKNISKKQSEELIKKIQSMGGSDFAPKTNYQYHVQRLNYDDNETTMDNIATIHEAIESKNKITFTYNCYGKDMKLHPKRGNDFKYVVSPYYVAVNNGRYYLVGVHDNHETISHYRIDRITNLDKTSQPIRYLRNFKKYSNNYELGQHMKEHTYMYSGDAVNVTLRIKESLLDDIIDWFGKDFSKVAEGNGTLDISIKSNENAMLYWTLQYGLNAEVLAPSSLREKVAHAAAEIYNKYHK